MLNKACFVRFSTLFWPLPSGNELTWTLLFLSVVVLKKIQRIEIITIVCFYYMKKVWMILTFKHAVPVEQLFVLSLVGEANVIIGTSAILL